MNHNGIRPIPLQAMSTGLNTYSTFFRAVYF